MKNDVNKIIITGNLTRDPELRHTPKGKPVCNLTLASNRTRKNEDGTVSEFAVFVDIAAWGALGETVNEYKKIGDPLLVEGELSMDSWKDQESGKGRTKLKIKAHDITFLPRAESKED